MNPDPRADVLSKQRDGAASELVKALPIVNGGGAAARLAFLQAIWVSSKELAKPTIWAIGSTATGAFLAAAFHLCRYQARCLVRWS